MKFIFHNRCVFFTKLIVAFLFLFSFFATVQASQLSAPLWISEIQGKPVSLNLYFFYSDTCPHCEDAQPVIREIVDSRPWLELKALPIREELNAETYFMLARGMGREANSVPAFFLCGEMIVGFDSREGIGALIESIADSCHEQVLTQTGNSTEDSKVVEFKSQLKGDANRMIQVPFIGDINPESLSLPVLTLLLAGMDAFNPCAFFVLMFLLSLLSHANSRGKMAIIGGVFVTISGLMYFLFMAAWLNIFLVLENVEWITLLAGIVAFTIGVLGVKDYFLFHKGASLSITETHKKSLIQRMRDLLSVESMPMLLLGTVLLAITANMYELLCTSGFPLVYTRILTLNNLSDSEQYLYLAFYNVIYVLPLLVIVSIFVATLGTRKLSEKEGRVLKLLSGLVMLSMGLTLIVAPQIFDNIFTAIVILLGAVLVTLIIVLLGKRFKSVS